jgi:hypothetical protein
VSARKKKTDTLWIEDVRAKLAAVIESASRHDVNDTRLARALCIDPKTLKRMWAGTRVRRRSWAVVASRLRTLEADQSEPWIIETKMRQRAAAHRASAKLDGRPQPRGEYRKNPIEVAKHYARVNRRLKDAKAHDRRKRVAAANAFLQAKEPLPSEAARRGRL